MEISRKFVCNKDDMLLTKNKLDNNYVLEFSIYNTKQPLEYIFTLKLMYYLIKTLNSDIIENIKILKKYNENKFDILIIFNRFGTELGISQKYMCIQICKLSNNNEIKFICNHIQNIDTIQESLKKMEIITINFCDINICYDSIDNTKINIKYTFDIDINEDLPIYMENMIGILMKKIFIRLKTYIENM